MTRAERIEAALRRAYAPTRLEVRDDSASHAGHAGAQPGGETHYEVAIASPAFAGRSRIERHRMVHAVLGEEFATGLHALSVRAEAG